jgi:predicted dithiol-disulfide oxidoreductase (DUF899 family)
VPSVHRKHRNDNGRSDVDGRADGTGRQAVSFVHVAAIEKRHQTNLAQGTKTKGAVIMATATSKPEHSKVVPPAEWLAARKELLQKEKEFTRLRDELSRQRRELPWEKVEKDYVFDGPKGKETLSDLFGGRGQLAVYHFMLGPGWKEGCPSCSFISDHIDASFAHLAARDVRLVVVSRAPLAEIQAFQKRMGWRFHWVSSFGSDFNYDYQVSMTKEELGKGEVYYNYGMQKFPSEERPGTSVFYKDQGGSVFHTYSSYGRGLDILIGAYNWLDLMPKGRDEEGLPHSMAWVRHHDKYIDGQIAVPPKT